MDEIFGMEGVLILDLKPYIHIVLGELESTLRECEPQYHLKGYFCQSVFIIIDQVYLPNIPGSQN